MKIIQQDRWHRVPRSAGPWLLALALILCFASRGEAGGTLCRRAAEHLMPLPRGRTVIELQVTGIMVHGTVTQTFHNPTDETIEVLYIFPLPQNAAVHHMEMRIGERRIVSHLQERAAAQKTYVTAKRVGKKAALLVQDRPNLFTASAANISPGETIEIVLEYIEELMFHGDEARLSVPLTFTPRFSPPSDTAHIPAPFIPTEDARGMRASISVRIEPGVPLASIASPSHDVQILAGEGIWTVRPWGEWLPADRDFHLTWSLMRGDEPASALLTEGDYGLLMIVPPMAGSASGRGLPTETLFVIDVSGSMRGPSIAQAREALLAALARLRPGDRFNLLRFNDENELFAEDFLAAEDEAARRAARRWVRRLRADGGTMILPALQRAIHKLNVRCTEHRRRIIVITDGAISNETRIFREIRQGLGDARLHTIGIGRAPNDYLVRRMARAGRGCVAYVSDLHHAENRIDEIMARIDRPVLAGISVAFGGVPIAETFPNPLPDLYAEDPLYLSFRLPDARRAESVTLGGRVAGGTFTMRVPLRSDTGAGIGVRWARAKVRSLMDSLHEEADPETVRAQVVATAMEFNLVTKYTSLVAVEEQPSSDDAGGRTVRMPNTLPQGSHLLGLPRGGTLSRLSLLIGLACLGLGLVILGTVKLTRIR